MLNAYKYDQHNRLLEARSFESGLSNNLWSPSKTSLKSKKMNSVGLKLLLLIAFTLTSCNDKLIRKKIENDSIVVQWFYYSYITNNSADFVEIYDKKSKSNIVVFEADYLILNVELKKDSVFIFIDKPRHGFVYTDFKSLENLFFNHVVIVDSSTFKGSIFDIPDGQKVPALLDF